MVILFSFSVLFGLLLIRPVFSQEPTAALWQQLLDLGREDVKWQEYGEFGLLFAPAEYLLTITGFRYEIHHVTSEDGYVLELMQLINPLVDRERMCKIPVILSHGFAQASYNFVCQSANRTRVAKWPRSSSRARSRSSGDRNLGITLANNGYDVWLVTSRGSLSSTRPHMKLHKRFSIHDPRFWSFSLDEQARYDIPAQVNAVLELTGADKVIFVGYSQSTFTMFGHLSLFPEFGKKLHTFVAVAPITSMQHGTGILRPISAVASNFLPDVLRSFALPPIHLGRILTKLLFLVYSWFPHTMEKIIAFIYNLFFGNNGGTAYDGLHLLGRIFRYPTSFKGFQHFLQSLHSEGMPFYDHGALINLKEYGSITPPSYNLSNIDHQGIVIYVGENDCLSDKKDNEKLVKQLQHPPVVHEIIPVWNHIDYVFGKDMDFWLNRPLLRLFNKRTAMRA